MQEMHVEVSGSGRRVELLSVGQSSACCPVERSCHYSETSPATMSLTDISREYFWGCELNKENPTFTWTFEEEEDDSDFLIHTLFLKQAVLGASALKDERNLIEVETKNFDNQTIKHPIVSLTLGRKDMSMLDFSFGHEYPVIFRLVEGSGPIHILAQQLVEFPDEKNDESQMDSELETEESQTEEELEEEGEVEEKTDKKRTKSKSKKDEEEEMDDDEEEDDDDEEEDDDDDEDDEEMEDEDEDMSSPEKSKKKKATKGGNSKPAKKEVSKTTKIPPKKNVKGKKVTSGKRAVKA